MPDATVSETAFISTVNAHRSALLAQLDLLADPQTTLAESVAIVQQQLLVKAWPWQEAYNEVDAYDNVIANGLHKAAKNICQQLQIIAEEHGLPTIHKEEETDPAVEQGDLANDYDDDLEGSAAENNSITDGETYENQDGNGLSAGYDNSFDNSENDGRGDSMDEFDEQEEFSDEEPGFDEEVIDTRVSFKPRLVFLSEDVAATCNALLAFLFHVINECRDDDRLVEKIDVATIARTSVSYIHASNPETSMRAARCLAQSMGLVHYHPPLAVVDVLLLRSQTVPYGNGSFVSKYNLTDFLAGDVTEVDKIPKSLYSDENYTILCDSLKRPEYRPFLVARQVYMQAALLIVLGPRGFQHALLDQAPRAFTALLDTCREPADQGDTLVKSSVVEATTMILDFTHDLETDVAIQQWKLAPLLTGLFARNVSSAYFHQLCDLLSFMPKQSLYSLLPAIVELTNEEHVDLRSQNQLLRTAIGTLPLPVQFVSKVVNQVADALNVNVQEITEKCVFANNGLYADNYDSDCTFCPVLLGRLMLIYDGLRIESGAEWERLVLNSQIPEACASLFGSREVLQFLSPSTITHAGKVISSLCADQQQRRQLLIDRNLSEPLLAGCHIMAEMAPSHPYMWSQLVDITRLIFLGDGDEFQVASDAQFTLFWSDLAKFLMDSLPSVVESIEINPGGFQFVKFPRKKHVGDPESIRCASKFFNVIQKRGKNEFFLEYSKKLVEVATVFPTEIDHVSAILEYVRNDSNFIENILTPHAVISAWPTLYRILQGIPHRTQHIDLFESSSLLKARIAYSSDTQADFDSYVKDLPVHEMIRLTNLSLSRTMDMKKYNLNFWLSRGSEEVKYCDAELLKLIVEDESSSSAERNINFLSELLSEYTQASEALVEYHARHVVEAIEFLAGKSDFHNWGNPLWDSLEVVTEKFINQNAQSTILDRIQRFVMPFLLKLFQKFGFSALRHHAVQYIHSAPFRLIEEAQQAGFLDKSVLIDPEAMLSTTEVWLHPLSGTERAVIFHFVAERALQSNEERKWLEITHKLLPKLEHKGASSLSSDISQFCIDYFSQFLARGKFSTSFPFEIWHDIWLWSNYSLRVSQYEDGDQVRSPCLPIKSQQKNFAEHCERLIVEGLSGKEFANLVWIFGLFCANDWNYYQYLVGRQFFSILFEHVPIETDSNVAYMMGRLVADFIMLTPWNLAARVYNMYNSRAIYHSYKDAPIEEFRAEIKATFGDARIDLRSIVHDILPTAVANIGDDEEPELAPWHMVEKAMNQLGVSEPRPRKFSDLNLYKHSPQSLRNLLVPIVRNFLETSDESKKFVSVVSLMECAKHSGEIRDYLVNEHPVVIAHCLRTYGSKFVTSDPRVEEKYKLVGNAKCAYDLVISLMTKAADESYSIDVREKLENSISVVCQSMYTVVSDTIGNARFSSIWGTCTHILVEFLQNEASRADIWACETATPSEVYESFQLQVLKKHKIVDLLVSASSRLDLSVHSSYLYRGDYLKLVNMYTAAAHIGYKPISSQADQASATQSSNSDSDLLDEAAASDLRTNHRDRVHAAHGNVFRNSVLGDYESNSENSMDDNSMDDEFMEQDYYGHDHSDHHHSRHADSESDGSFTASDSNSYEIERIPSSDDSSVDYEIELVLPDDGSVSDATFSESGGSPIVEINLDGDDLDDANGVENGVTENGLRPNIDFEGQFDGVVYPSIATEGGEVMLLYDDNGALQVLDDFDEEDPERENLEYTHEYTGNALGVCLPDDSEVLSSQNAQLTIWDRLVAERELEEPRLPFRVVQMAQHEALASFVEFSDPDVEQRFQDILVSPEFALLGRKKSFIADASRTHEIIPQIVGSIVKVISTYVNQTTDEFGLINNFFGILIKTDAAKHAVMSLVVQLIVTAKGDLKRVQALSTSDVSSAEALNASSSRFCINLLRVLKDLFESHRHSSKLRKLACEIWAKYGTELVGLLTTPLIAHNRLSLQSTALLINSVTHLLPENERLPKNLDSRTLIRLVQVLASEECTSVIFSVIGDLFSSQFKADELVPYIGKELKRSKNDLVALLSRFSSDENLDTRLKLVNALVPAEVRILRLLSVVERLFDNATALVMFKRINFLPLWQLSLDHLATVGKVQIAGTIASMALLEVIAIPANIIKAQHDQLTEDSSAGSDHEETLNFTAQMISFLRQKLSLHGPSINELLKAKPRLSKGSLGSLAMNYDLLNLEGKEVILEAELKALKSAHKDKAFTLEVNRGNVFETSMAEINSFSPCDLKSLLEIKFEGELGEDAGGLAREWLEILGREFANPQRHLFCSTTAGSSMQQIDPASASDPHAAELFKFVGRVLGRAVYDRRTVNLHFSRAIYRFLKNHQVCLQDMEAVDEEYYRSLVWMLNNNITDVFYETFSVEFEDGNGKKKVVDLIPNGRHISVTEDNKQEYVNRIVDHKLIGGVRNQLEALRGGFHDVIPRDLIKLFDAPELELLITGTPKIDVEDWYRNTSYLGYTASSPQVKWFWDSVRSFNDEQRAKLLQFCTGTSRVPVRGFGQLESHTNTHCFQLAIEKGSTARLPTAHTCMNQITVPRYESYKKLRQQLLIAISEGFEGFGFA